MKRTHAYIFTLIAYTFSAQAVYITADAESGSATKTLAFNSLPAPLTPPIVRASVAPEVKAGKKKAAPSRTPTLAHYQRAQSFKKKGDQPHEMIELIKSTQENPKFVKAYYELALIFREKGYLKLAQSTLEQALAIKSDYSEARILLAALQLQQGNLGGAMTQLGQTIGLSMPADKSDLSDKDTPAASVLQSLHSPIPTKENSSKASARTEPGQSAPNPIKAFWIKPYPPIDKQPEDTDVAPSLVPVSKAHGEQGSAAVHDAAEPVSFASLLHLKNPFSFFKRSDSARETRAKSKKVAHGKERKKKEKKKSHRWFRKFFDLGGRSALASDDFIPKVPQSKNETGTSSNLVQAVATPMPKTALQTAPTPLPKIERPSNQAQTAGLQTAVKKMPTGSPAASSLPRPFQSPDSVLSRSTLFRPPPRVAEEEKPEAPIPYPGSDDPWSVRLRYLAEHGTGTLTEGEAFMFSEETGEATLFLADGKTVRRQIYVAKDSDEVIKERRPDILAPDDLMYNVSLLAKLMPRATESAASKQGLPVVPQSVPLAAPAAAPSTFGVDNLMGKSQGFWGWIKGVLNL